MSIINGIKPQKVKYLSKELELKKPNLAGEFLITEKFDGWWVQIPFSVEKGWQVPVSSAMRKIPAFEWVAKYMNSTGLRPKFNCIVIVEAIIQDTPFHILNGKFNRSVGLCNCVDVHFKVHDILHEQSYDAITRYKQSIEFVETSIKYTLHLFSSTKLLLLSDYNQDLWNKTFEQVINRGGEGIIAKRAIGLYQSGKRNSDLLKLKLEATFDLLCKEVYYTVGEKGNNNMNLRLSRASGTEVTVRVGKHSDIAKFEEESPIGKVVEVRCMKELPDGALREPRFSWLREDKLVSEID